MSTDNVRIKHRIDRSLLNNCRLIDEKMGITPREYINKALADDVEHMKVILFQSQSTTE